MLTLLLLMLAFWLLAGTVLVVVCFYALLAGAGFTDLLIAWLIHPILGVVWDALCSLPRAAFGRRSGASPDAAASPSPPPARRVRIGLTEWESPVPEARLRHDMPDGSEVLLPRGGGHHAHTGHRGGLGRQRSGRTSVRPDGRASHSAMRRSS